MLLWILIVVAAVVVIAGLAFVIRPRSAERYRDEGGLDRVKWDATDHGSPPNQPF